MLKEFYSLFKKELEDAYIKIGNTKCDKCSGFLVKRKSKTGEFLGCNNYPKCKNTKSL